MNHNIHLTSAGNTYNGCLYVLRTKGCQLSVEEFDENGSVELLWRAEKDGNTFAADSPVELLGIYTLWENLGEGWNHQKPDILNELFEAP